MEINMKFSNKINLFVFWSGFLILTLITFKPKKVEAAANNAQYRAVALSVAPSFFASPVYQSMSFFYAGVPAGVLNVHSRCGMTAYYGGADSGYLSIAKPLGRLSPEWCTPNEYYEDFVSILDQVDGMTSGLNFYSFGVDQNLIPNFTSFGNMPLISQTSEWLQGLDLEKYQVNHAMAGQCFATANAMTILGLKSISPESVLGNEFDDPNDSQVAEVPCDLQSDKKTLICGNSRKKIYWGHAVHVDAAAKRGADFQDATEVTFTDGHSALERLAKTIFYNGKWWLTSRDTTSIFDDKKRLDYDLSGMNWIKDNFKQILAKNESYTLILHSLSAKTIGNGIESDSAHAVSLNGFSGNRLIFYDPWGVVTHVEFDSNWKYPFAGKTKNVTLMSGKKFTVKWPDDKYFVLKQVGGSPGFIGTFVKPRTYIWDPNVNPNFDPNLDWYFEEQYKNVAYILGILGGAPFPKTTTTNYELFIQKYKDQGAQSYYMNQPYPYQPGHCTFSPTNFPVDGKNYRTYTNSYFPPGKTLKLGCLSLREVSGDGNVNSALLHINGYYVARCDSNNKITVLENHCGPRPYEKICAAENGTGVQTLDSKKDDFNRTYFDGSYGVCHPEVCNPGYFPEMGYWNPDTPDAYIGFKCQPDCEAMNLANRNGLYCDWHYLMECKLPRGATSVRWLTRDNTCAFDQLKCDKFHYLSKSKKECLVNPAKYCNAPPGKRCLSDLSDPVPCDGGGFYCEGGNSTIQPKQCSIHPNRAQPVPSNVYSSEFTSGNSSDSDCYYTKFNCLLGDKYDVNTKTCFKVTKGNYKERCPGGNLDYEKWDCVSDQVCSDRGKKVYKSLINYCSSRDQSLEASMKLRKVKK